MTTPSPLIPSSHRARNRVRVCGGFTIIELLISVAIIFVLIGFVLVGLRGARRGAERAESLNALKQMTTAYIGYATEHDGRLLPGYIHPDDFVAGGGTFDINVRLKTGYDLDAAGSAADNDASSYVWRLAPYLNHNWDAFMKDYRDAELDARFSGEYGDGSAAGAYGSESAGATQLGIATAPSYGLNSIYLGGDSYHGPADHSPWNDGKRPYVASRLSDVLNPTKIIVFGASRREPYPPPAPFVLDSIAGYCELRAPQVYDAGNALVSQWSIDAVSGQAAWAGGAIGGTPFARLGDDKVPISHLDGHVEAETLGRLSVDMSRWAPNAISAQ